MRINSGGVWRRLGITGQFLVARRLFGADHRPGYIPTRGQHLLETLNNAGGAERLTRAECFFTRDQASPPDPDEVLPLSVALWHWR